MKLGLAYLQQALNGGDPDALLLVAERVPLEVLVAHRLGAALSLGTEEGSAAALLKLGVWKAMNHHERDEALPPASRLARPFCLPIAVESRLPKLCRIAPGSAGQAEIACYNPPAFAGAPAPPRRGADASARWMPR